MIQVIEIRTFKHECINKVSKEKSIAIFTDGGESIAGIKRRFQQTTTGIQQADHDSSEEELRDVERIKNIVDAKISSDEESDGEVLISNLNCLKILKFIEVAAKTIEEKNSDR